jgi:predicted phage-related endonuclease
MSIKDVDATVKLPAVAEMQELWSKVSEKGCATGKKKDGFPEVYTKVRS